MEKIYIVIGIIVIILLGLLVYFLVRKYRKKKTDSIGSLQQYGTSPTLSHTVFYANWAQFWKDGPMGTTGVNDPSTFSSFIQGVDKLIFGYAMFKVIPSPVYDLSNWCDVSDTSVVFLNNIQTFSFI